MQGVKYRGQPVYREWSADRRTIYFLSRKIEKLADGKTWKFISWVQLKEAKIDRRWKLERRMQAVAALTQEVLKMPGIKVSAGKTLANSRS